MIKKTSNYEIFKLRNDNRTSGVIEKHVKALERSILGKNMLEWRPIIVNAEMEVIDGQHRLQAAKNLKLPIYYDVKESIVPDDIVRLNISRQWTIMDFFNFHLKNNAPEYYKLDEYMKKNNINLRIALMIMNGHNHEKTMEFKNGEFKFKEEEIAENINYCWDTIGFIRKIQGQSSWVQSAKFWSALLVLTKHAEFDFKKWYDNLEKHISKIGARANFKDYLEMILLVYNWRNPHQIKIDEIDLKVKE